MKRLLSLFLIVTIASCSGTAEEETYNGNNWREGDQITYNLDIFKIRKSNDSIISANKSFNRLELIIESIGDTDKTVTSQLSFSLPIPDSLLTELDYLTGDTLEFINEREIIYKTDKTGAYQWMINWDEVKEKVFTDMYKALDIDTTDSESMERLRGLEKTLLRDELIMESYTQDIIALHLVYSLSRDSNQVYHLSNSYDSFSNKLLVENLESIGNISLIRITNQLDSTYLESEMNDLTDQLSFSEEASLTSITFNRSDTFLIYFNESTHWPDEVYYWKTVNGGGITQITGGTLWGNLIN